MSRLQLKYQKLIILKSGMLKLVDDKKLSGLQVAEWVKRKVELNDFIGNMKVDEDTSNLVAVFIAELGVSVYNSFRDASNARNILLHALMINGIQQDLRHQIKNEINSLEEIMSGSKSIARINPKPSVKKNVGLSNSGNVTKNKKLKSYIPALLKIAAALIFGVWVYNGYIEENNSSRYVSSSYSDNSISNSNTPTKYSVPTQKKVVETPSPFKGNSLRDGESPFTSCFGSGDYSGGAELLIKNGGSTDAIICLKNTSTGLTIRNEYVRKSSSFRMIKIPQGTYEIKCFHGNDWNPNKINGCGGRGNFESNIDFDQFDGSQFFQDDWEGSTIAEITLYSVYSGNATTSNINENQFFN